MAMLSDFLYIDPTLYNIQYVQISTLTIVLIVYSTSGHFWHQSDSCNPIPIYWEYLWIPISNCSEYIWNPISDYSEILLACFTLKTTLTSIYAMLSYD